MHYAVTRLLPKDFGLKFGACSSPLSKTASGSTLRVPTNTFHGEIAHRLWSSVIHWRELQALKPICSGGFGLVFKGTYFDETVAVKKVRCVKNKLASRQSFWSFWRVIAATTCTPTHLTKDNIGTIVMEFAGALNLQQVIYGLTDPLPLDKCVKYSVDIARALQHLQAHGIVHLDLKPANVLAEIFPRVDMYSFGITMWQLLTREPPYEGHRQYVLYAVVEYNLRPSIARDVFIQSSLGQKCQKLISLCWDGDPSVRPTHQKFRLVTQCASSKILPKP
uniref:non-specific serine/threonine protein kinase n=1 Tax=Sinocyclocheilus anshuiensis TaxID=1608454 RepID=A0A671PL56_9TELE